MLRKRVLHAFEVNPKMSAFPLTDRRAVDRAVTRIAVDERLATLFSRHGGSDDAICRTFLSLYFRELEARRD